jgi:RNA polymerase primary sigma factor
VRAVGSKEERIMTATAAHHGLRPDDAAQPERRRSGRPGLSRDEEVELAGLAARGDLQARDRMVGANLGLVRTIARDFRGRGLEPDDLVGEGHLGLIRAVERFDPRHGTRFSTYASHWIKQAIREALMNTAPTIRLPAYMVGLLTRWRRAERALGRELGRRPQFDEVAMSLGLSAAQRDMVARAMESRRIRLAGGYGEAVGDGVLAEATDDHRAEEPVEAEDERALLGRRMGRLDDRERMTLALRYGLEGEPMTLKAIGRRLGVTREWVRKLEVRALAKLGDE